MFYAAIVGVLVVTFLNTPAVVLAGEVDQIVPISFGTILLHPMGDTVVINANSGSAEPAGVRSEVIGGRSGKITLSSTASEHADIIYPASVTLDDGTNQIIIEDIRAYSQYSSTGVDVDANTSVEINIGGTLKLSSGEVPGSYKGTMVISIIFS